MNRRPLIVLTLAIVASFSVLQIESAWARAGGGTSSGSRGSRSTVAPARPAPEAPAAPRPTTPGTVTPPTAPRPSPWGGIFGALGGFMLGGLLGGLLFGRGGFGIGLFDLLLIGAGIALLVSFMRRRAASPEPAYAGGSSGGTSSSSYAATVEAPAGESELERGIGYIRQMDPSFEPNAFAATARSSFLAVQDAIMR